MKFSVLALVLAVSFAGFGATAAPADEIAAAAAAAAAPVAGGAQACKALVGSGFAGVVDAPTSLMKATYVEAAEGFPAYCDVAGYVTPSEGFALWLPANWNGKFLTRGCGGFCGIVAAEFACKDPIRVGYACLQTDMGHKSTLTDGVWAYHDPQAKIDFAYRATHATVLAGKAILAAYYERPAALNYFLGCSTGGRQAMVEAQRFPRDFDGIASIAPAIDETGVSIQLTWSIAANRAAGRNILPPEKVAMLHAAVVAACDLNDGAGGQCGDGQGARASEEHRHERVAANRFVLIRRVLPVGGFRGDMEI